MNTPLQDLSGLYYTYSTIAQTLAGAFGFLIAVVLFQMQGLNTRVFQLADRLRGWIEQGPGYDQEDLRTLVQVGNIDSFVDILKTAKFSIGEQHRHFQLKEQIHAQFYFELAKLRSLGAKLKRAMKPTAIDIAACLVVIPLTPFINTYMGRTFV